MSNKEKDEKPKKVHEELIKNDQPKIEKSRDLGKSEWINENKEQLSYRPIKDEQGLPPAGDDSEE